MGFPNVETEDGKELIKYLEECDFVKDSFRHYEIVSQSASLITRARIITDTCNFLMARDFKIARDNFRGNGVMLKVLPNGDYHEVIFRMDKNRVYIRLNENCEREESEDSEGDL